MRHDDRDELGITIGNIKLLYVVKAMRAWGNGRRLISCYELDGKPERYLMWVSEPELLSFQKFRLRSLEAGQIMLRHAADGESAVGRRQWTNDIAAAITAGATLTTTSPELETNCKWIGGRH